MSFHLFPRRVSSVMSIPNVFAMGLVFESFLYDLLALIGTLFGLLTWYFNSNFDYWKKQGVHYLKPEPFFGNLREALTARKSLAEALRDLYNRFEGHRFGGAFRLRYPFLIVRDPELIKQILVKDFQYFQGQGAKVNPKNLVLLSGPIWHALRTKLTPTFTSGKMKMMFQLMEECSVQLSKYVAEHSTKSNILEMRDVVAKFTTDVIGTCAFGLQFNSMSDENAVEYREKNNIKRNDFMQLMIQLKNQVIIEDRHHDTSKHATVDANEDGKLEIMDSLMAAQVFVFFFAGFETFSTAISFALYELAVNPDIQARLREEVDSNLEECRGKITYEAIQSMEYLDRVLAETLRKYPPIPNLMRQSFKSYNIPGTNVILEKGTPVMIPAFAIHRDPKYYPDPERFDPDRFTTENKAKRHHFSYLPFGEGPRNCIGMRFGLLQSKIGLFTLLSNYEFSVCESTDVPLKLNPKSPLFASTSGINLRVIKRT